MPDDLGGRLARGGRLAATTVAGAAGLASARAKRLVGGGEDPVEAHHEFAGRLASVLGDMKGAAMKVGQLLSFVDLDLPPDVLSAYHAGLARLRDAAPSFDADAIEAVIVDAYGAGPDEVFASFDPEPLAAASIGQVHAATLADGRDVVVKVQYPGVAEAVAADLRNAETFAPLARVLSPNQEIRPLLDELRERITDELDYRREAQYQGAFATRYREHPFIVVPDVVRELCRDRVLVAERVHGERFEEFVERATPAEAQEVGEIVFRYAFGSIGRFRLFNGDPHPGNYLVLGPSEAHAGPRVAFLDYGSVKMFSTEDFAAMRRIEDAMSGGRRDEALAALTAAGFIPRAEDVDLDVVYEWFQLYTRPVVADQPFTFTADFAREVLSSTTDPRSPYNEVIRRLNLPPEYLLLNRIQWGLNSVLAKLGASNDWRAIRDEYVVEGATPATPLGAEDAAWWSTHGGTSGGAG